MTDLSRLEWTAGDALDANMAAAFLGPGAPFEIAVEPVLGTTLPVFANRPRSLMQLLSTAAARFPERDYLVFPDRTLTYGNVTAPIAAAATRLRNEFGIGKGDRVAIAAANCAEYAITFWAATSLGAITVALNGWWTAPELAYGIAHTTPRVVFADARRRERLADAGPIEAPVVTFDGQWWGTESVDTHVPLTDVDEDDPYLILFTSGTTGRPKGAVLSQRGTIHFVWSSMATGAVHATVHQLPPQPARACTLSGAPMFHVSGMTSQVILAAATGLIVVYPPAGRWDEETHLRLTEEHGVTSWGLVPTQVWRLLDHPALDRYDLSSLASIGGGSSVWAPELIRRIGEKIPHVRTSVRLGYGMTETTGLGTLLLPPFTNAHPDSVGSASAGVEVEVRDPATGRAVPIGEIGEVCFRTASAFLGYWDNPPATATAIDDERWYRTGDFGVIRDGRLHLEGRRSDLIIRGGENIYPAEIENRLLEHPDVADVAVIGLDHPTLGQEVKAVAVRSANTLTADALRTWAAKTLASFKVPTYIEFVDELPRNATGKVVKQLLIEPQLASTFIAE
jgi:acyl-CoA synthetase (AMP-forming)/AMP-acid ligase II